MGPGFMGPPPGAMNEKLKEPLPKRLRDVPGYLKRVSHSFFSRLLYVIKLVWEAKKSLLIMMIVVAAFNGVSPVFAAYISANLLNRVAEVLSLHAPSIKEIVPILLPAMLLQFGYMFFVNNITAGRYGDMRYSDDATFIDEFWGVETVKVSEGDELVVFATTYDPESPWAAPAGTVGVYVAFEGIGSNKEAARKGGKMIAERALAKGIEEVTFDRGGFLYHGRVAELADGAREAGLKF